MVPENVAVIEVGNLNRPFFHRRASTLRAAERVLKDHDLLYARMPNHEAYWCECVARKLGMPLLVELHGDPETAILEEDRGGIIRRISRRYRALHAKRILREMSRRAFCAVSIGPELARKYIPSTTPTLLTTNHLLESREYHPRSMFALRSPPQILFVGDLQRRKGLQVMFAALARMKAAGRDFQMILVGTGPQEAALAAYARQHGFGRCVDFLGQVPHGAKLFEFFQHADLFVLPSIAAEGVPRVTHEAMAQGCPVVATDVGSTAWQLREGAGVVVPPNNVDALVQAIIAVLDDSALREKLSRKGFQRSLSHTYEKQRQEIHAFVLPYLEKLQSRSTIRTPPRKCD